MTRIYHKCGSVVDHEREDPWRHWLRRRFRAVHCAACAEEESQKLIKTWSSWFDTVQVGVWEDIQLLRMASADLDTEGTSEYCWICTVPQGSWEDCIGCSDSNCVGQWVVYSSLYCRCDM